MKLVRFATLLVCPILLLAACDQAQENVSEQAEDPPSAEAQVAVTPTNVARVRKGKVSDVLIPVPDDHEPPSNPELDFEEGWGPEVPEVEVTTPTVDFDMTIEPGYVAKSIKAWIPEYARVDAVLYDYSADEGFSLVKNGKLHKGVVDQFTKTLTKDEIARLEGFVTGSRTKDLGAMCYLPHHGFVFYDGKNNILGHLEVCLMCMNYQYAPHLMDKGAGPLSDNWDLEGMKALLKENGFPVFDHPKKWETFFKEQK